MATTNTSLLPKLGLQALKSLGDLLEQHADLGQKVQERLASEGPALWAEFGDMTPKVLAAEAGWSEDKARYVLLALLISALPGHERADLTKVYSLAVKAHKTGSFRQFRATVGPNTTANQAISALTTITNANATAKAKGLTNAQGAEAREKAAAERKALAQEKDAATPDSIRLLTAKAELGKCKGDGSVTREMADEVIAMINALVEEEVPS